MSTGLECQFIEPTPNSWYYILQDPSCPRCAWDWREYATAHGPFPSREAASENLSRNHANPGGFTVIRNADFRMDEVVEKLIATAWEPTTSGGSRSPNGRLVTRGPFIVVRP